MLRLGVACNLQKVPKILDTACLRYDFVFPEGGYRTAAEPAIDWFEARYGWQYFTPITRPADVPSATVVDLNDIHSTDFKGISDAIEAYLVNEFGYKP